MYRLNIDSTVYVILTLLLLGIQLRIVSFLVVLFLLLVYLITLNRHEAAVSLSLVLPGAFGLVFTYFNIGMPGSLFAFILTIIVLRDDLIDIFFSKYLQSFLFVLPIVLLCVFCMSIDGFTPSGIKKLTNMIITIVFSGISIVTLAYFQDIRVSKLVPVFIIYGLLVFSLFYDYYSPMNPDGLFDFETFRTAVMLNRHSDEFNVSYHIPGLAGATALAFYLSEKKEQFEWSSILLFFCSFLMILYSGARQAIVAFIIIILVSYIIKTDLLSITRLIILIFSFFFVLIVLRHIDISFVQSVIESNSFEESINRNYDYAYGIIANNPLFGVGFGCYYNPITEEIYPHNIILEILCEMGIVGMTLVCILIIFYCFWTGINSRTQIQNGCYSIVLFAPYLVKALISDDLSGNIIVFVMFFVLMTNNIDENFEYEIFE